MDAINSAVHMVWTLVNVFVRTHECPHVDMTSGTSRVQVGAGGPLMSPTSVLSFTVTPASQLHVHDIITTDLFAES